MGLGNLPGATPKAEHPTSLYLNLWKFLKAVPYIEVHIPYLKPHIFFWLHSTVILEFLFFFKNLLRTKNVSNNIQKLFYEEKYVLEKSKKFTVTNNPKKISRPKLERATSIRVAPKKITKLWAQTRGLRGRCRSNEFPQPMGDRLLWCNQQWHMTTTWLNTSAKLC